MVVSFVAVLELMKRQLVGVINADLKGHDTAADDEFAENSHIGQLTLQWLA